MFYHKIVLWIFAAFLFVTAITPPAWAIKPRPPLQLSLQQIPLSGGQSQLMMIARANIDISHVDLSLELPLGLSLVEGEEEWEGPLKKGETKQIELIVQSPNKAPHQVTGKAVIELTAGEKFVEKATLTLNEAKSDSPRRAPSVKRKEGGETILQFKGK
ncbi:MAG: hypothetical protein MPW17_05225 [Candidatus Manganitrophus sp.]|nr:hypothetical protein [Candidatus Manganitrophus sp.]WDT72238.1 MAG: hypothetical protein MPW17_05225 [Candidatus Manganitrophus sp.]